jgi:hypothetical protein
MGRAMMRGRLFCVLATVILIGSQCHGEDLRKTEQALVLELRKRTSDAPPAESFLFTALPHKTMGPWATAFAFSPTAPVVASVADDAIRLWDLRTGKATAEFPGVPGVQADGTTQLVFSPDGSLLACRSQNDRFIEVYRLGDGKLLRRLILDEPVYRITFTPDGSSLAAFTSRGPHIEGTLRTWKLPSLESGPLKRDFYGEMIWGFSPDGSHWFTATNLKTAPRIELIQLPTGKRTTHEVKTPLSGVALAPGGRLLYLCRAEKADGKPWVLERIDLAKYEVKQLGRTSLPRKNLSVSPDGKWLRTEEDNWFARLQDAETGRERCSGVNVPRLDGFSPGGVLFVNATQAGQVGLGLVEDLVDPRWADRAELFDQIREKTGGIQLGRGGTIRLTLNQTDKISLTRLLELVPDCTGLSLRNLPASALPQIAKLARLEWLELVVFRELPDEALAFLEDCKGLREFRISGCQTLTDDCLKYVGTLTKLRRLTLWDMSRLNGSGFKDLKKLTQLQEITLANNLRPSHFRHLGALKGLTKLDLTGRNLNDEQLEFVSELTELTELKLIYNFITDAGLKHLQGLKKLRVLELGVENRIRGPGLKHLLELKNLEFLALDNCGLDEKRLEHLGKMSHLRMLRLWGTQLTDPALEQLTGMTGLEYLTLNRLPIKGPGLAHLKGLKHLKYLDLSDTEISDKGLEALKEWDHLESLVILNKPMMTGTGMIHLKELPNLHRLYFSVPGITRDGLKAIGELRRLRRLELRYVAIGAKDFPLLHELKDLQRLVFPPGISREESAAMAELRKALPTTSISDR